jgi:multiple antibiotic resistance protein
LEDLSTIGLGIVMAILIVAMANPFLLAPMMIGSTGGMSKAQTRSVAIMAVLTGGGILIGSIFIGNMVLNLFGITTTALQVAGGLIFISLGFGMLGSNSNRPSVDPAAEEETAAAHAQAIEGPNPGIFPLGMPGIGGPGLIAMFISVAALRDSTIDSIAMAVGIVAAMAFIFVALLLAPKLAKLLGQGGIDVLTKLMGLIVMALAVVLITSGVGELWPGLMN